MAQHKGKAPRLGLALGGGGARGFAHIGVILGLLEEGLAPGLLAGTSMGAIVAALYAVGQDLKRLSELISVLDLNRLFGVTNSYRRALERAFLQSLFGGLRGHYPGEEDMKLLSRFREFLWLLCKGKRFEELDVELYVVATDLKGGKEVVLHRGAVHEAVLASAALPGVIPPVPMGRMLLTDGGVVNNLPVDIAAERGCDVVLGVLLRTETGFEPRTPADVLLRSFSVASRRLLEMKIERARSLLGEGLVIIRPEVSGIGALEFHKVREALEAGREAVKPCIKVLKDLLRG